MSAGKARRPFASQASTSNAALSPPRHRKSSRNQRGLPTPGTGRGEDGRTETRQRVTAAVGSPNNAASAGRRKRRMAMPVTPEVSAASCNRREAFIGNFASSPITAPKPLQRKPSSKQSSTPFSSRHSTMMTRFCDRPACVNPGMNRSLRVTHHKTLPDSLAATPAAKSAAAAPSAAPLPPPLTSCRQPSFSPPPGKW